jgi:hypothetical protein
MPVSERIAIRPNDQILRGGREKRYRDQCDSERKLMTGGLGS